MNNPDLRVLHLRSSGGFYGAEAVLASYFASLQNSRANMELLLLTGLKEHPLRHRIHAPVRIIEAPGGFSFAVFQAVKAHLEQGRYDILHTHDYKSDLFGFLLRKKVHWVSTMHGWTSSDAKVRLYEKLDRLVLPSAHGVAAVSLELFDQLGQMGVKQERAVYLPNAIDCDAFAPADRRESRGRCRIATVARLSSEKAIQVLVEALAALPETVHLSIIGDGPLRQPLQQLAAELAIDNRIDFLGVRNDIPALLAQTDIFVLPSLREGTPMALLEAMAAGCAPVASAVGNIPHIIQEGVNGLLIAPGDVTSLIAALSKLVTNQAWRSSLGEAARTFVRQHYSLPRLGEQLFAFYSNLN